MYFKICNTKKVFGLDIFQSKMVYLLKYAHIYMCMDISKPKFRYGVTFCLLFSVFLPGFSLYFDKKIEKYDPIDEQLIEKQN